MPIYLPSQKERCLKFIEMTFDKKKAVKVDEITEAKTMPQNRYIWLVFTVIAEDSGNTKEDVCQYYYQRFPKYKEMTINGELVNIQMTMSDLEFKKNYMTKFIDEVVIDARVEGYIIPAPEDKEALDQFNYYKSRGLI